MKQFFTFIIFSFLVLQIHTSEAQTRMDSLMFERQNLYQSFILKMDPKIFTDPNFVNTLNDMSSIDSLISEESHRIDSTFAANEKMSPMIGVTMENLRSKRDRAQTYFYISLLFLAGMIGLAIYLAEKLKTMTKNIVFLEADISEANNNYSRVSEEKIIIHREMNIKIKSFEHKIDVLVNENQNLITENKRIIEDYKKLLSSKTNQNTISNQFLVENKLLKEAIKILENQKFDLEKELKKQTNIKPINEAEIEQIKTEFTKRIEHLENALKTKDIMDGVIAKRSKELEDVISEMKEHVNQLTTELEDEKAYNEKLSNRVAFYEEEINDKDQELKTLWNKISQQVASKQQTINVKSEDPETNMLKRLEKLSRLKQAEILSDDEYNTLKEKIIGQY
jgi:hypothetical protein